MNIFLPFEKKKKKTDHKTGLGDARPAAARMGDHQKGKLCTAGRKIIVLPQVKNIVALLKSARKASYIIRMFKY